MADDHLEDAEGHLGIVRVPPRPRRHLPAGAEEEWGIGGDEELAAEGVTDGQPVEGQPGSVEAIGVVVGETVGSVHERNLPLGELSAERLAVLADALEDAGATEEILAHLRSSGPHVRGCWALDLVLGQA
jgi:hypothetical protein